MENKQQKIWERDWFCAVPYDKKMEEERESVVPSDDAGDERPLSVLISVLCTEYTSQYLFIQFGMSHGPLWGIHSIVNTVSFFSVAYVVSKTTLSSS